MRMRMALEFKKEDCWIGVFWKRQKLNRLCLKTRRYGERLETHVWVCLLPCLPIHLTFTGAWRYVERN